MARGRRRSEGAGRPRTGRRPRSGRGPILRIRGRSARRDERGSALDRAACRRARRRGVRSRRQVHLASRRDAGCDRERPHRSEWVPGSRGHARHPCGGAGPGRRRRSGWTGSAPDSRGRPTGAPAPRRVSRPRQFGDGPSSPRRSPRRPALRFDSDGRRFALAPPDAPDRGPARPDGGARRDRRGRHAAASSARRAAPRRYRPSPRGAERAGEVVPAARGPLRSGPHPDPGVGPDS